MKSVPGICTRDEGVTDANECECANGLPQKCQENFCSVTQAHCEFVTGTSEESNMNAGEPQVCTPPPDYPIDCTNWVGGLTWLPSGTKSNLLSWCETEYPSSFSTDQLQLHSCIVRQVQDGIGNVSIGYQTQVSSRVSAAVSYDDESMRDMYLDLHNGWSGNPSLSHTLLAIFQSSYSSCCCAVSPGPLLAWLSSE